MNGLAGPVKRLSFRLLSKMPVLLLFLSLAVILVFSVLPVPNRSQAYLSGILVAIMMAILFVHKRMRLADHWVALFRVLSIFLATYLIFRYLVWRAEYTIGGFGVLSLIAGGLLFAAEIYAAGYSLLGFFVSMNPRDRPSAPFPEDESLLPCVDVVVPTYNEPEDILEVTLLGATSIRYPRDRLRVHLLDDGGTDDRCSSPGTGAQARHRRETLQALCGRVGAVYHTRVHNEHAKAGNINAAIAGLTGDLMVIIDADHVPAREFLENTVGFFLGDPLCAIVQTPHSFINPDPVEKNLDILRESPPEPELFQFRIQQGLDGWGSSFFCGSAAIIRRSMLLEIGGIQTDTLTEDVETAMILHARGYHSVFLGKSMVLGLQPETMTSFIAQRIRWAQGPSRSCR